MRNELLWAVTAMALVALALAGFGLSLGPASECSTRAEIRWWPSLPVFFLYVTSGGYLTWFGSRPQRLVLFGASSIILAGYVVGLSLGLPEILQNEKICAAQGMR